LEDDGEEADEGVDRGHAGVEEEGGEEGAVDVVDCLWEGSVSEMRAAVWYGGRREGGGGGTYEAACHRPVPPRQFLDP
jgi:hypothetical protein